MSIYRKLLEGKVKPASSEVDHEDNQWLEPASFDKNAVKQMSGEPDMMDSDDFMDDNLKTGVKGKDTSKASHTTSSGNPEMPVVKESEQLAEISMKRASKYVMKATKDVEDLDNQKKEATLKKNAASRKFDQTGDDDADMDAREYDDVAQKASRKMNNRVKGMITARRKMNKRANVNVNESEQLDEVSKSRADSYVKRASNEFTMANFALRSTEGPRGNENDVKQWRRKEHNRKKGVFTAIDKLEGRAKVNVKEDEDYGVDREMECWDILDEISEMLECCDHESVDWTAVLTHMRDAAFNIRQLCCPEVDESDVYESVLDEAFRPGNLKLRDGSTVKLTKEDASLLNNMYETSSNRKEMLNTITKNMKEMTDALTFVRSINEDFAQDGVEIKISRVLKYIGKE